MCVFPCAKNKLGFQTLTNSTYLHYLTGTWKGWETESKNRPVSGSLQGWGESPR